MTESQGFTVPVDPLKKELRVLFCVASLTGAVADLILTTISP